MVHIGVITSLPSETNIRKAAEPYCGRCQFTFMPYETLEQMYENYRQRKDEFDGILFSGHLSYQCILVREAPPSVPHAYVQMTEQDYCQAMLRILYQNPRLDIRRILVESSSSIPWGEILGDETAVPVSAPVTATGVAGSILNGDIYSEYFDAYCQLWESRRVDFICTRIANISPRLTAAGIPHELLFPSKYSIDAAIKGLLQMIEGHRSMDSLSVIGLLCPKHEDGGSQVKQLRRQLGAYNMQSGLFMAFQTRENQLIVFTSNTALRQITQNYSCCQISEYLRRECSCDFALGWGVGYDTLGALRNAERALKEAMRSQEMGTYLVTEDNRLIGPMMSGKNFVTTTAPGTDAMALSKDIGITSTNCQKLLDLRLQRAPLLLTRNELASYLNVTLRTANRILTRLVELGAASIVATEQRQAAGRPMAVYDIRLETLLKKS